MRTGCQRKAYRCEHYQLYKQRGYTPSSVARALMRCTMLIKRLSPSSVSQYVRVPEMGWGDVCGISRDKRGCQRFRFFVKAVKVEPCPQRVDFVPAKLRQALIE